MTTTEPAPTATPTASGAALRQLPLGHVLPAGWLERQLRLQAGGITGLLEDVWPDVGPDSAWLGGDGEDWERGPYYADGLVPLAHLTGDAGLLAKAGRWAGSILGSQREDGQFGPATNDDWWPRMVACKVLTQHADAAGQGSEQHAAVLSFLRRWFAFAAAHLPARPLTSWGRVRGADLVLSVLWLHERTGDPGLLDLAETVLGQTADWHTHLTEGLRSEPTPTFDHLDHGPNVAMGLKTSAVAALVAAARGEPGALAAGAARTAAEVAALDAAHGMVHGGFSGDEWVAGRGAHHGTETCQVVEHLFTLEQLARVHGDRAHADTLEVVGYNLLPASSDPAMLAHQYHQQANQVRVDVDRRDWTFSGDDANVFGLEPHFGCCTANLHQGWPKLVASLWAAHAADDGREGLTAVAHGPCTVRTLVGGEEVALRVDTDYPFDATVRVVVEAAGDSSWPLRLRVPAWCDDPSLTVAGEPVDVVADERGFATLDRTWSPGDEVVLTLPMAVRTVPRDHGAVGVRRGPLVMVLSPGETWHPVPSAPGPAEWHISPRSSWNYGLVLDEPGADGEGASGPASWPVSTSPVGEVPFALADAPVRVSAQGCHVDDWRVHHASAAPVPPGPLEVVTPVQDVALVPYGSARIRVAEVPVVRPRTAHP